LKIDHPVKRFILIGILGIFCLSSFAQRQLLKNLTTFDDKRLHFGFSLGINALDFEIEHWNPIGANPKTWDESGRFITEKVISVDSTNIVRGDVKKLIPGFTVGIVTNLRLNEYFDLRFLPGLSFGERKIYYNIPVHDINNSETSEYYSIKSTFLDFPLLVKYKSKRMNNQRPYVIAGPAYRVDISKTGEEDLVRLKPGNWYVEAGIGWDSYLQFFRLSTELKFSFGLNDILDKGPKSTQLQVYTNSVSSMTSNIFTLSFHFE
jgi:hypothetical protein